MAVEDDILLLAEDIVRTKAKHSAESGEMRARHESELAPLMNMYRKLLEGAGLKHDDRHLGHQQQHVQPRRGGFQKDPNSVSQRVLALLAGKGSPMSTTQIAMALSVDPKSARYALLEHQKKDRITKPGTGLWQFNKKLAGANGNLELKA